jgi:small subunit ribosomal protein S14
VAKVSAVEKNNKRARMIKKNVARREKLKAIVMNRELPIEERFEAQMKLAELPRNSAKNRHRNRCELTGRPRGVYRKFRMSRIMLRELGGFGQIPGLTKSSW